jgi:hypothetical protein
VYERDGQAALADGRSDALDRAGPNVAAGEDAWHARLEEVAVAVEVPFDADADVGAGEHVAARVECDLQRKPAGLRVCTDEQEQPPDSSRVVSCLSAPRTSIVWIEVAPCAATTSVRYRTSTLGRAASWSIR